MKRKILTHALRIVTGAILIIVGSLLVWKFNWIIYITGFLLGSYLIGFLIFGD